jgi:PIN domain nuclease of toxin-antitoxin system
MNRVLDACAMIAFLRGEKGGSVVARILADSVDTCFAHSVNLCEVYYDFVRVAGKRTARAAINDLQAAGVQTRRDMNKAFWLEVGNHKGTIRRISLADCFAIALSRNSGEMSLHQTIMNLIRWLRLAFAKFISCDRQI